MLVTTVLGTTLHASRSGDDIFVNPTGTDILAKIITADIATCAGTVHVIDRVLVPARADNPAPVEVPVVEVYEGTGAY